jgi:Fe-S cluster assembly ATP-binding protein
MLKIEGLKANVLDRPILKGISLEMRPGEVHAIMDPMAQVRAPRRAFFRGAPGMKSRPER